MTDIEREGLYMGVRNFREKQVTSGLSLDEEKALKTLLEQVDTDIKKVHKMQVNFSDEQMKAPVKVEAIRNATFVESPVKRNFLDKVMKKEQIVYYNLQVPNWADLDSYEWTYTFALEVRSFMEQVGLGDKWSTLLPPIMEISAVESLDKEEVEWLNLLPDTKWCLTAFDEVDELEKLAKQHSEEMYESITWLKEHWKDGYQIYSDYTELGFIQLS